MTDEFIYIAENYQQLNEVSNVNLTELDENNFESSNFQFKEKEVPLEPEPSMVQKGINMAKKAFNSIWD